ncbi:MAG: hypothetical protein IRZ07_14430 [Microbispora sp.]|nr:hypothetical protein [Microbispora sp.]
MATMRDSRPQAAELFAALPAGRPVRTAAVAVAGPIAAGLVVALVSALHFVSLLGGTPAGRFDAYEVLTGVMVAALMAALGAALTRWAPTLFLTGPLWPWPWIDDPAWANVHLGWLAALPIPCVLLAVGNRDILRK